VRGILSRRMVSSTESTLLEPRTLLLTQIGELNARVEAIAAQTRVLRDRTMATRRQIQASRAARVSRATSLVDGRDGRPAFTAQPSAPPAANPSESSMLSLLTKRMREILYLLVQGMSEKEVAVKLGVSPHTVHIHVTRMYARVGVNSRAELLARFYRQSPSRMSN